MDYYGDLPPSPGLPPASSDPSGTTAGSTSTVAQAAPTLDQELDAFKASLGNVSASFGTFWGSVRKQSQTAYNASKRELEALNEAARKDFAPLVNKARDDLAPLYAKAREDIAPYVTKAREELNALGEQAKNSAAAGQAVATGAAPPPSDGLSAPSTSSSSSASAETLDATPTDGTTSREATTPSAMPATSAGGDISFYGEVMTSPNSGTAPPLPDEAPAQVNALIHRMQHLQTQIQANPSIAKVSRGLPNLSQIQANIAQLQARLPDQLQRSEAYLNRATKEFSDLLNNAVRVVPPTAAEQAALAAARSGGSKVLTRKEALLHRLRSDPAVMIVDPAQPPPPATTATEPTAAGGLEVPATSEDGTTTPASDDFKARTDAREDFATFLQAIEQEGGLEGEVWQAKVQAELALGDGEGAALATSLAALVPEKMPAEAFWTRYFFRVHQIDEDDARRRQVLEGAGQQSEDDFSWDVEEEEGESPKHAPAGSTSKARHAASSSGTSPDLVNPPSIAISSATPSMKQDSGRNSSEDGGTEMSGTSSYDVVSRKASEDEQAKGADDDEDSDWE